MENLEGLDDGWQVVYDRHLEGPSASENSRDALEFTYDIGERVAEGGTL